MKIQNDMKWLLFLLCSLFAMPVLAQVTNAIPAVTTEVIGKVDIWDIGIGIVAPLFIWGLTKIAPKIPKPVLPTITPLVGVGLGLLVNWLAGQNLSWFESAKAGSMAVFFREITNQWVTKKMAEPDAGVDVESTPVEK